MSQITQAVAARQTQVAQLQSEIKTLQHAASIMAPPATVAAKPKPKAAAKSAPQPKPQPRPKQKSKSKRHVWTAAEKAAIGKRMKAYWAKRRKAKG